MKKNFVVFSLIMVLTLVFTGCSPKPASPESPAGTTVDTNKVVYLINGALGDNAFYDSGQAGMETIKKDYGLEIRTIEDGYDAGQYEPGLEAAVNYADVIFVISYGFEDLLSEYADKYPNKIIVNLDTTVQNSKNTITSVDYVEEESAYLAGIVAGMMTIDTSIPNINDKKIIGAVGGDVDPVINAFMFGYENGAKSIDSEIKTERKYLGDWVDTAKGKQAAMQLYDMGSDINFQIAAGAGLGVLQAAQERNLYSIGVDTNQNALVPGFVTCSDIKDIGKSIMTVFKTIKDGTYVPGQVINAGLASGAIDVVFDDNGGIVPQYIIDKVDEVRQKVINGETKVELYVPQQ